MPNVSSRRPRLRRKILLKSRRLKPLNKRKRLLKRNYLMMMSSKFKLKKSLRPYPRIKKEDWRNNRKSHLQKRIRSPKKKKLRSKSKYRSHRLNQRCLRRLNPKNKENLIWKNRNPLLLPSLNHQLKLMKVRKILVKMPNVSLKKPRQRSKSPKKRVSSKFFDLLFNRVSMAIAKKRPPKALQKITTALIILNYLAKTQNHKSTPS